MDRLLTRGDFDGIVCAALLRRLGLVDEVAFVHPREMQHGEISVGPGDITANLPYVPGCRIGFDHHVSEALRTADVAPPEFINRPGAPSAARVVYDYYGGADAFGPLPDGLMDAVDRADSAQFSQSEILFPTGYVLVNFLLDARTGLGRFRDFRVSNEELLRLMVDAVVTRSEEALLLLPDVSERVRLYFEHEQYFKAQIHRCGDLRDATLVLDLRDEEPIFAGNRFMPYALFPEAALSVHCLNSVAKDRTVFAIGRSILNRASALNIGELCLEFGGGGHATAGTCEVPLDQAGGVLEQIEERARAAV